MNILLSLVLLPHVWMPVEKGNAPMHRRQVQHCCTSVCQGASTNQLLIISECSSVDSRGESALARAEGTDRKQTDRERQVCSAS